MRIMIADLLKPTIERITEAICAWKLTGIFNCCCGFKHKTQEWPNCDKKWFHELRLQKLDPWKWWPYELIRDILLVIFRQNSYDDQVIAGRIIEYELLHANTDIDIQLGFKITSYKVQFSNKEDAIWALNKSENAGIKKYLVLGRNKQESDYLCSALDYDLYKYLKCAYPGSLPVVLLARFDEHDNVIVWLKAMTLDDVDPPMFGPRHPWRDFKAFQKKFKKTKVLIKTLQITPAGPVYAQERVYMTPQELYERLINEKKDNDYWVIKPHMRTYTDSGGKAFGIILEGKRCT
jgi:hypothetical protein